VDIDAASKSPLPKNSAMTLNPFGLLFSCAKNLSCKQSAPAVKHCSAYTLLTPLLKRSCPRKQLQKNRCPLTGQGLSISRTCNLCWQPLGYALYNRPITIKSELCACKAHLLSSPGPHGPLDVQDGSELRSTQRAFLLILSQAAQIE